MNTVSDRKFPMVECRDVWKLYGERASEALIAFRDEGMSREEISEHFDCVVGVAGASFEAHEGEVLCIMGLSGSGKSTLVRHINRLLEPTAGEIFIDSEDILKKSDAELREMRSRKIGMVFQNNALLPHRTVLDNVALPLQIQGMTRRKRYDVAEQTLNMVDLDGWGDCYPHQLSGGMQQRVNLARAMAADPQILLMDEPFSALDPIIRRQLQDEFIALSKVMAKTTIFITHDLDEAIRIGDRIAIMKDGEIVQSGTAEGIVLNPANDYVRNFIAGIPRTEFIRAHNVMIPIEQYRLQNQSADLSTCVRASDKNNLNELIDLVSSTDQPVVIFNNHGEQVGVIDKVHLLKKIQANNSAGGIQ